MECITISSDEEEVQVLSVKLESSKKSNSNDNNIKAVKRESNDKEASLNGSTPTEKKIPLISLIDDNEDGETESKSFAKNLGLRPRSKNDSSQKKAESLSSQNVSKKLQNGHKENLNHIKKLSIGNEPKKKKDQPADEFGSNEHLIQKLLELCRKVEYGAEMELVERKIWNYFRSASEFKTHSVEFKNYLEEAISKIEEILKATQDKLMISRIIKDCINEMKSDPNVVTGKLRQLYSFYEKLVKRIEKLEELDAESDDDGGNPYILLDKYRKKAVATYNKICELEGRSADADRPTLQRFFFNSTSAPIPVQRALEKYYNKTHIFPDFYDVKKLVKKVNKEENLKLSENEIYKTAQSVFVEFGERLIHRRKYDDYNILVDYLKNGQIADPADLDTELLMKLEQNKRSRKKEQEVLDRYAMQDALNVKKKDEESTSGSKTKETNEVKPPSLGEISTINVSSSSSSDSSISSSPAQSENEDTDAEEGDDEHSKLGTEKANILFSDSEEELVIDLDDKRKRLDEKNEASGSSNNKRLKTDDELEKEVEDKVQNVSLTKRKGS